MSRPALTRSISPAAMGALVSMASPASPCDLPGELSFGASALAEPVAGELLRAKLIAAGGRNRAPNSVRRRFPEHCARHRAYAAILATRGDPPIYPAGPGIAIITKLGWRIILADQGLSRPSKGWRRHRRLAKARGRVA